MCDVVQAAKASVELPSEVLVQILRYVPATERLGTCALVQTSWQQAALAATENVDVGLDNQDDFDSLQAWLQQHGQDLTEVRLSCSSRIDEENLQLQQPLPCPKLLSLELKRFFDVCLEADPGSNILRHCSDLQHLEVHGCYLTENSRRLDGLLAVTGLTSLMLKGLGAPNGVQPCSPALLGLTNLRELAIEDIRPEGMVQPQYFPGFFSAPYEAAQYPLHGLTKLSFRLMAVSFTPEVTPHLMQLTSLEDLEFSNCHDIYEGLTPALLAAFTSLRRLRLESNVLLDNDGNRVHNPTALLAVLPQLARLTELQLIDTV